METLKEILSPDFLLRNSVYTSVLVGFACPLVGVFLVLRRLVFMGVALPQISSTGVALALSLPLWLGLKMDVPWTFRVVTLPVVTYAVVAMRFP